MVIDLMRFNNQKGIVLIVLLILNAGSIHHSVSIFAVCLLFTLEMETRGISCDFYDCVCRLDRKFIRVQMVKSSEAT